jgi:heterodisulfide reductase subunit A
VAAAIAKTKKQEALEPIRVDAKRHALVLGGGIAGLRAAIDLSRRGIEVVLVEKSPFLGGRTANLDKLVPTGEKAGDLIRYLAEKVIEDPNIAVLTCAEVVRSEGYVGNFTITVTRRPPRDDEALKKLELAASRQAAVGDFIPFAGIFAGPIPEAAEEIKLETGAIVFATGFTPYVPLKGEYGFKENAEVITLPDLIRSMAESPSGGTKLQIGGRKIERVALIHCVGSRQIPGLHEADAEGNLNEYCSRTCCSATLQAASEIRERYPETNVFEYYRDIRTYGRGQEEYYERASKNGVIFFRFEPEDPPVIERTRSAKHSLVVKAKDTLTFGEEVEAEVDLVVLAVGMQSSNISDLVEMMKLPVGADRFLLEVHPKLRPVELANTGVLLAGTCQAPMDVTEACNAAQAASAKASILLTKGFVELDPFVANVDLDRCTGRGACQEACPIEGAIQVVEMQVEGQTVKRGQVNAALCTGCGTCVAVCPDNAIDVKGWELEQYEAMVDAIVAA